MCNIIFTYCLLFKCWTIFSVTLNKHLSFVSSTKKMEKNLHKALDDILAKPGVTGVLCADENGLCLASKGVIDSSSSGSLVHLMQLASKLEPSRSPILRLESEAKDILVQSDGGLTLAVVRNNKKWFKDLDVHMYLFDICLILYYT